MFCASALVLLSSQTQRVRCSELIEAQANLDTMACFSAKVQDWRVIAEVHTTCTAMGIDATRKTIHSPVIIGHISHLVPAGLPIPVVTLTPCMGSLPTASDPGTCWSGHRKRLPGCGLVSSFFLACPTAHIGYRINYPQRLERDNTTFVRMWRVPRAWNATLPAARGVSL